MNAKNGDQKPYFDWATSGGCCTTVITWGLAATALPIYHQS